MVFVVRKKENLTAVMTHAMYRHIYIGKAIASPCQASMALDMMMCTGDEIVGIDQDVRYDISSVRYRLHYTSTC